MNTQIIMRYHVQVISYIEWKGADTDGFCHLTLHALLLPHLPAMQIQGHTNELNICVKTRHYTYVSEANN